MSRGQCPARYGAARVSREDVRRIMLEELEEGGCVLSPALHTGALGLLFSAEGRPCSGDLLRWRTRAEGGAAITSLGHRWVGDELGDDTVPSRGGGCHVAAAASAGTAPSPSWAAGGSQGPRAGRPRHPRGRRRAWETHCASPAGTWSPRPRDGGRGCWAAGTGCSGPEGRPEPAGDVA